MSCTVPTFCSPPNWAVLFPELVGPPGPINGTIRGSVTAGTYVLSLFAFKASTLSQIALKLSAGTATATVRINGVPVTGLTNISLTNALQLFTATAVGGISVGATIDIVVSSAIGATDLSFTLNTPTI